MEYNTKQREILDSISKQDIENALELHTKQLERLGATLEDSICCILRKLLEANKLEN